jgi:HK97 family phage portal protein
MLPNPLAGRSYSGKTVSVDSALELIPLYSGIQLISGTVASLPIRVYQDTSDGGRVVAPKHRAQKLLDRPTSTMAGDEWRQIAAVHLLTWGNFYALKERSPDGYISQLWPVDPSVVKVARKKGSRDLEYWVGDQRFDQSSILHIRGMGDDGVVGFSPVLQARNMLGMAASLEEFTSKFFANGARPGVILRHPSRLSPEAAERLRAQWHAAHSGSSNAFSTVVVEEGIDVSTLTMPISDSELVALSKLTDVRTAQLLRIPPSLLMTDTGGSLTYSTQESETRAFYGALRPWLVRIEQALLRDPDIFSDVGLGAQYQPAFDVTGLLRGDNKTTAEIDVMLVGAGIITVDEARQNLGLNPMMETTHADVPVSASDAFVTGVDAPAQSDTSAPQSA